MNLPGVNVYTLLPLTHEYQMKHLTECCEKVLMSMEEHTSHKYGPKINDSSTNITKIRNDTILHLVLADTYDLPKLRRYCISESSKLRIYDLEQRPDYPKLEPSTLIEVLKSMLRAREEGC